MGRVVAGYWFDPLESSSPWFFRMLVLLVRSRMKLRMPLTGLSEEHLRWKMGPKVGRHAHMTPKQGSTAAQMKL